jgi:hypothetical protein
MICPIWVVVNLHIKEFRIYWLFYTRSIVTSIYKMHAMGNYLLYILLCLFYLDLGQAC